MDAVKRVAGFWLIWTAISLAGLAVTALGLAFVSLAS